MKHSQTTCPQCGEMAIADASNPWRPFCSERCRLIDLGAWLDETHRITGEENVNIAGDDSGTDEPTRH
jgi:uncharacterized protein